MKEHLYDKMLNIRTAGNQAGFHKSLHYHRYEPTPYSALESFFKEYNLNAKDTIVDFGCGKGRLNFFLNYLFNSNVIGIEMNEAFYIEAIENKDRYLKNYNSRAEKIEFVCCLAEEYKIGPTENCFYFFNPFSVQIFISVINNILLSVEENSREVDIILYYPSEDYIYYLESQSPFTMVKEFNLPDHNPNERFLVYRLSFN
ncbi:methyltransferase [Bacillus sp. JJ1609]|uniref:methyltransferase n=1 Tax=Bacillus sp. JJ1609 TaxID=3122977 RepID=UPI002FFE30BC